MRLGIVGAASSHVDQVLRLAGSGALGHDVRVTALVAPDAEPAPDDRLARLAVLDQASWLVPVRAGAPAEVARVLAAQADAVFLVTRDGRGHRALADPLLRAGLPLLVDKPFTLDPDDAAHLVRLAEAAGVPLTSASALRLHPAIRAERARWRPEPDGFTVAVSGPADPHSPHGGLAFAAVHVVEAALGVLRDRPAGPVAVARGAGTRTALVPAGRDVAVLTVAEPRDGVGSEYRLSVTGARGRSDVAVDLGADYLLPVLAGFVAGVRAGAVAPAGTELVDAVRVLAELCR